MRTKHIPAVLCALACGLAALPAAYSQRQSPDVRVSEITPVHIRVVNRISPPPGMIAAKVFVFNRLPLPTPWYPGPGNVQWKPTGGSIRKDDAHSNSDFNRGLQSFQCQAYPGEVMAWEGEYPVPVVTCDYDLTLARRTFNARKYLGSTTDELASLPQSLHDEVVAAQKAIEPEIATLARGQMSVDKRLVTFLQAASDFCGREIRRGVTDSAGKPIARYDAAVAFRERRGWCGPQSSLFRAFCIAVGIPAREASGYALKRIGVTDGEINMSDKRGIPDPTKDGNAHVWAEVYFPHVGWIEINVGAGDCFDVPATFVKVSGIEAPFIVYRDGRGAQTMDPFGPHITVTRR